MNNFSKSIMYSSFVLAAGLVAIFAIYNNDATNRNMGMIAAIEPAAGEEAETKSTDLNAIAEAVKETAENAYEATTETMNNVAEATAKTVNDVADAASETTAEAIEATKEAATDAADTASNTMDAMKNAINTEPAAGEETADTVEATE